MSLFVFNSCVRVGCVLHVSNVWNKTRQSTLLLLFTESKEMMKLKREAVTGCDLSIGCSCDGRREITTDTGVSAPEKTFQRKNYFKHPDAKCFWRRVLRTETGTMLDKNPTEWDIYTELPSNFEHNFVFYLLLSKRMFLDKKIKETFLLVVDVGLISVTSCTSFHNQRLLFLFSKTLQEIIKTISIKLFYMRYLFCNARQ